MARAEGVFTNRRLLAWAAFLAAAFVTAATTSPAMAQVTDFTIFRSGEYEQIGATTVDSLYYYFASTADASSDYTSASLVTPTTEFPMSGPNASEPAFSYSSPQFASLTLLNDNYPAGTYTLEATNASDDVFGRSHLRRDGQLCAAANLDPDVIQWSCNSTQARAILSPSTHSRRPRELSALFSSPSPTSPPTRSCIRTRPKHLTTTSFSVPGSDFAPATVTSRSSCFPLGTRSRPALHRTGGPMPEPGRDWVGFAHGGLVHNWSA